MTRGKERISLRRRQLVLGAAAGAAGWLGGCGGGSGGEDALAPARPPPPLPEDPELAGELNRCGAPAEVATPALPRRNVLLVSFDDLNDWAGFTGGHPQARTPNMDRLAQMGMAFTNAYTPYPLCGPARASALTGLTPLHTGITSNAGRMQEACPGAPTIVSVLKQAGYVTAGFGKVTNYADDLSWDFRHDNTAKDVTPDGVPALNGLFDRGNPDDRELFDTDWGPSVQDYESMPDTAALRRAQEYLRAAPGAPFLLALGFRTPHLPWYLPARYFDRFPLDSVQLPEVLADDLADMPSAFAGNGERWHDRIVQTGNWRPGVRAYLAALSYADDLLGELLDTLDEQELWESTTVVLWSDNGFHLGEKERWAKKLLTEDSTRVPLAIVAPGLVAPARRCARPVSLVDLLPTIAHLNGLPAPRAIDGRSLYPLLQDPAGLRRPAGMDLGRSAQAVRSTQWRYVRWRTGEEELYDHAADPHEWRNLAGRADLAWVKRALGCWLPET